MSTLGQRLKAARTQKGLLQSQLAEMIGVKSGAVISNWEKDIAKPDAEKIVRLCSTLGIAASYLLGYHGEDAPALTVDEESLLSCYRSLNPDGQDVLLSTARGLSSNPEYIKKGTSEAC